MPIDASGFPIGAAKVKQQMRLLLKGFDLCTLCPVEQDGILPCWTVR